MKEKFPALFAALQVEEMQMSEDGAFLNMGLLETLNAAIEAKQKEVSDAKQLADQLNNEKAELSAQIDTLKAEHQTKVDELNATVEDKQNAIAALEQEKADLQADVNAKAENIETLTTELNGAKAAVETAQQTIAERDQTISDLNAQIAELENDPGEAGAAGSPATNGQGAQEQKEYQPASYVYNNDLTYEENMEAERQWNEAHNQA
jgi:chromosome segregation ATPase